MALTVRRTIERVRAEFVEMPDLRLTAPQLQRLCGVDSSTCGAILAALVDAQFLKLGQDGRYSRADNSAYPHRTAS